MERSPAKFDVSVVGELNLDIILSGLPEKLQLDHEHLAAGLNVTLGSSSAIFAHNFALLGNQVGFSSAVGSDSFADTCLQRLGESGVDISGVRRVPDRQTGLTVILP
ncbi:MAG TPA: carbohydrate kinase family protein, partial [Candidatus Acidoferrum sp.]